MIISTQEIEKIAQAIFKRERFLLVSLDLGISKIKLELTKKGFLYEGRELILPEIKKNDKSCYILKDNELKKLQFLAYDTQFIYKLIPTSYRPILQISGTTMHKREFLEMLEKEIFRGKVLDSGTGLGYSAIVAARTATEVITIEIDKNVIQMARLNPYSKDLFEKKSIKQICGNIIEEICNFKDEDFSSIILDGGTPRSSNLFFSKENYREVYRVLKKGGKLYHYVPRVQIHSGRDFAGEIVNRLKKSGFKKIQRNDAGSYLIAIK